MANYKELDIKKFEPRDYYYWGQWNQPVLSWSFWEYWSFGDNAKDLPVKINYEPTPILFVDGHFYIKKTNYFDRIIEVIYKEISSETRPLIDYLFGLAKDFDEKGADLLATLSWEPDYLAYIQKSFVLHKKAMFFWTCSVVFDQAIERYFNGSNFSESDREQMLTQGKAEIKPLSFKDREALEHFRLQMIQSGFSKKDDLVAVLTNNPTLGKLISDYQKNTEYIGTHHFWGEPRGIPELLEQVWQSNELETGKLKEPKIKLQSQNKYLAELCTRASLWRLQIAERVAQIDYAARPALNRLALNNNLNYEQLLAYSCEEILSAVNSKGILVDVWDSISSRQAGFVGSIDTTTASLQIGTGKVVEEFIDKFTNNVDIAEKVELIKGAIGNKGKVVGRVVIVLLPTDIHKAEAGTVLVTSMTTPDFLPAMKKAVAFVTDIGGITCHAAIVSREMNKPCIIGTKIATKVLHDGDEVEVDADKGVVKIIKRA